MRVEYAQLWEPSRLIQMSLRLNLIRVNHLYSILDELLLFYYYYLKTELKATKMIWLLAKKTWSWGNRWGFSCRLLQCADHVTCRSECDWSSRVVQSNHWLMLELYCELFVTFTLVLFTGATFLRLRCTTASTCFLRVLIPFI